MGTPRSHRPLWAVFLGADPWFNRSIKSTLYYTRVLLLNLGSVKLREKLYRRSRITRGSAKYPNLPCTDPWSLLNPLINGVEGTWDQSTRRRR